MTGSRLVLSGRQPQPADLALLIEQERVTFSSGVPTVWMTLYNYFESQPHDLSSLRMVFVAGAALPPQFIELYQKKHGIHFMLGWGMTEISPIATVTSMKSHLKSLPEEQRLDLMAPPRVSHSHGVDIRIVDPAGEELRLGTRDGYGRTAKLVARGSRGVIIAIRAAMLRSRMGGFGPATSPRLTQKATFKSQIARRIW